MLTHLSIRNIVLIEKADIEFSRGLCVLSGETGAGKSILLDALGLALGARGEARLVRAGAGAATVSATFEVAGYAAIASLLGEYGIEAEDTLLLRRQLTEDGKSRAFINDQPVSQKTMQAVGAALVEIHGQHQQRGLLDAASHCILLDRYGGLQGEAGEVATRWQAWRAKLRALSELREALERTAREKEYLEHMQGELSALAPQPGEEEELADKRIRMIQSEKLAQTLNDVLGELTQPRRAVEILRAAQNMLLRSTLKDSTQFAPVIDALDKACDGALEAEQALEEIGQGCAYSREELEAVEERLFSLKGVARKYNITTDELPNLKQQVKDKLDMLASQEKAISRLESEAREVREAYLLAADALAQSRRKVAVKLEKALHAELTPLKMQATRFRVTHEPLAEAQWRESGMERIFFEVATNKGALFGPLEQIASGGELSRFMLALAVVLADAKATPVMIFDEIDSGTGGAVADAIGKRLERLGQFAQVLVVTHLPQVAARGARHYFIEKKERAGNTHTGIFELTGEARREELARMLSGAAVNDAARRAADALLGVG